MALVELTEQLASEPHVRGQVDVAAPPHPFLEVGQGQREHALDDDERGTRT